jgi:hypothetical protein
VACCTGQCCIWEYARHLTRKPQKHRIHFSSCCPRTPICASNKVEAVADIGAWGNVAGAGTTSDPPYHTGLEYDASVLSTLLSHPYYPHSLYPLADHFSSSFAHLVGYAHDILVLQQSGTVQSIQPIQGTSWLRRQ